MVCMVCLCCPAKREACSFCKSSNLHTIIKPVTAPFCDITKRIFSVDFILGWNCVIIHFEHVRSQCSMTIISSCEPCSLEVLLPLFDISHISNNSGFCLCKVEIKHNTVFV